MTPQDTLGLSGTLTPNEQDIARYLLDHPEEAARISSRELARRTLTSASAVQRFCRKLGYTSYKEFQLGIVERTRGARITSGVIASGTRAVTALAKVAELEAQAVEETRRMLSIEVMDALASLLRERSYIDIFARDESATMARYASYNLSHAGKVATVYDDVDRMLFHALSTPTDHLAFVISRRGKDEPLIATTRLLRKRGMPVVVVTADTSSELAQLGTHVIWGYYQPEFEKLGEVIFGMVIKYLFDALFVMAYAHDRDQAQTIYAAFEDAFASLRQ